MGSLRYGTGTDSGSVQYGITGIMDKSLASADAAIPQRRVKNS
eukprot:COSAG02_NODE_27300_length_612_cov_1.656920_1_plen_43_part_00